MSHLLKITPALLLLIFCTGCGEISMLTSNLNDIYATRSESLSNSDTATEKGGVGINLGIGGGEPVRTQVNEVRAVADCPQWQIGLAFIMDRESYSACWGF